MQANVGDTLLVHGRIVGQHDKTAEVVEVLGQKGSPRTGCASTTATRLCCLRAPTPKYATTSRSDSVRRTHSGRIVIGHHPGHRPDPVRPDLLRREEAVPPHSFVPARQREMA